MTASPGKKSADVLDRQLHVTVWKSSGAKEAGGGKTTMRALVKAIKERKAPSKEQLFWLKLGRFGDKATENGALRNNENLIEIEGLEGDYDGKRVSFETAVEVAEKAGLACIIYTSPSHTPEEPKWRVLAPFSTALEPIERDALMGRLNGLFATRGATFDAASWTLSQSYYYGYVEGNEAAHQVELIEGQPIDLMDELAPLWTPKPLHKAKFEDSEGHDGAYRRYASDVELDIEAVLKSIETGQNFHNALLSYAAHLFGKGYERDQVETALHQVMQAVPEPLRDPRWRRRSSRGHINSIVNWVCHRENSKLFRRIREKEARQEDARTSEPPPEPDPEPEAKEEPKEQARGTSGKANEKPTAKDEKKTVTNAMTLRRAMARYPETVGLVAYDEFSETIFLRKPIPDPDRGKKNGFEPRPWRDADEVMLAIWFQSIGYLKTSRSLAFDVVAAICEENRFHAVRDYLGGLTHDGVARISTLLTRGFGAVPEDAGHAAYIEAVGRAILIGAVARVYVPGCKADAMAILEGPQGAYKSSGVRALVPDEDWFSDTLPHDLSGKDARQHLPGKWLVEMSEISQLRKAEVETLKSFLTTQVDKYRPSYGRVEVSRKRQSLFVGTTNEDAYLADVTGNRRFWPVKVGAVDLEWIRTNRDQLWAEAVKAFRAGERWWLTDAEAERAVSEQASRMVYDEWEPIVMAWANEKSGDVTIGDILADALFIPANHQGKPEQMRVAAVLKKNGYQKRRKDRGVAGRYVVWVKDDLSDKMEF